MVNKLIEWSIQYRYAVILISCVLLVAGVVVTKDMSVDVFPDLTAPTVTVMTEGNGMAPLEMETMVTFPIEAAVNGAAGVRRVRSGTAVGISVVWVEFEWGTDVNRARQVVAERVASVSASLPRGVEKPTLSPVSSIMGEIVFAGLTSDKHDGIDLRRFAQTKVRRRVLSVPGVSQVAIMGGDEKQYQVVLAPERLRAFNVTVEDVVDAMRSSNENVAAGILVRGGQETLVQGVGRIEGIDDIATTLVCKRNDVPIRVSDLGVIAIGGALKRGTGSASFRGADGTPSTLPAVIVAIQKQPSANTLRVTDDLDLVFDELDAALPAGMRIHRGLFRQADFIRTSLQHTAEALRDGSVIVIAIVLLFLVSFRASLITILAIPISLAITVLGLALTGSSINTMTLGGMAIAIGALVDDAIIDVENIVRRLRMNASLPEAQRASIKDVVFNASVEVRASIVFATLIILLVFAPLFFLDGVEGRLLFPLGVSFCLALGASLVTALTLTPALSSLLLPTSRTVRSGKDAAIVRWLKLIYGPVVRFATRRSRSVAFAALLLLGASIFGLTKVGSSFLPEFNEGALVVGLVSLPGTSLDESDKIARSVELALMKHPEVKAIGRRTGRAEDDEHVQGVEASEIDLTLDFSAQGGREGPQRTKEELLTQLRADLSAIPGVVATFGQPIGHRIDHMLSGTRASIAIKLFGDDLLRLQHLARQVETVVKDVRGVVDLSTEQQASVPSLRITYDREKALRHSVELSSLSTAIEAAMRGVTATEVVEGQATTEVVVKVKGRGGQAVDRDMIGDVGVPSGDGAIIPLKELARIEDDVSPNFISRENLQRKIVVMCNVADRDVGGVVAEIRERIKANVPLPEGSRIEYGGQFETAEVTSRRLSWLGIFVIFGVAMVLYATFRSVRDTALIMANLPLALIGGVAGVIVGGGVLSIAGIIGFITVFGIAVRNGILLVAHVHHIQEHENVTDYKVAVMRAAEERLAPILMTAMAAGLALVPIALAKGEPGTEILSPMAIVILFGLLSSTLLNMIVVPALLVRFGRSRMPVTERGVS